MWGVLRRNWQFVLHGTLCALTYTFGLYPFLHHMGSLMLLFELSSIPFNVRIIMLQLGVGKGRAFELVQLAFGLSFLGARLGMGIPASLYWWADMLALLRSGAAHSVAICVFYLIANLVLNSLNILWASIIVRKAAKRFGSGAGKKVA